MALLDDLSLSAFMSSKICHDLVGPVGAINNGLELLEEEDDDETRAYALQLIQNSARSAAARLEFARLAFGASSGIGGSVDLAHAEKIARRFIEDGKHTLIWENLSGAISKDHIRLLLNMACVSLHAIPGGGTVMLEIKGALSHPSFAIRCSGRTARIPDIAREIFAGATPERLEPRTIVSYLAYRLASQLNYAVSMTKTGNDVIFLVAPVSSCPVSS